MLSAQAVRPFLWDAARGAVVGVLVYATWFGAWRYAASATGAPPGETPLGGLGATATTAVTVGIPAVLVVALLAGWVLRLKRPWLVSGLGVLSHLFCCGVVAAIENARGVWLFGAAVSALAYAASAAAVGYGARTPPPAGPALRPDG